MEQRRRVELADERLDERVGGTNMLGVLLTGCSKLGQSIGGFVAWVSAVSLDPVETEVSAFSEELDQANQHPSLGNIMLGLAGPLSNANDVATIRSNDDLVSSTAK